MDLIWVENLHQRPLDTNNPWNMKGVFSPKNMGYNRIKMTETWVPMVTNKL